MVAGLWLLLLAAGTLSAPDWADDCPSSCRCKWSSGKKTALCRAAGFTAVPSALSSDMQVLDLSGNSIPYLTADAFRSVGLVNLQRVFLRAAGLRDLHKDAFRDLRILVEVDLSDNSVHSLHPDTFSGNERLRVLCLSGNPLAELRDAQFPYLPHLRTLELQGCAMRRVHVGAFTNLAALDSLNLRSNELRQLDSRVFRPVGKLKTLALDGNPWRCDCELRGFRAWLVPSNLYSVTLTCAEPQDLQGRAWQDLDAGEFACAPEVQLDGGGLVQRDVGGNVTFHCRATGDPEPEVAWLFNGRPLGSGYGNSSPEAVFVVDEESRPRERLTNLSVFNVTEQDAGEYSCVARNSRGAASGNATLLLPQVVTATTLSKADSWLLWAGIVGGGAAALCSALCTVACICCLCGRRAAHRRRRGRHRRKNKLKGSVSFTDQEKKLLDVSITTTERPSGGGSCEGLGSPPDMELLEQSQSIPLELCDPPVHITIESHTTEAEHGSVGDGAYPGTIAVFPPPPEFSTSLLPAGAFGNIFISVSVNQEPAALAAATVAVDAQRYPDLLDIPHRAKASVSVAAGPDAPFCAAFATLPRHKDRGPGPQYDNMGPRVTAGGSSTLSLPDTELAEAQLLDDIPPPPLPPLCTPLAGEYVAL